MSSQVSIMSLALDNETVVFFGNQSATTRHGESTEMTFFTYDELDNAAWYPDMGGMIRIPLYTIIFVLGLVGNSLVIITLAKNRRLRFVTNVFLLNLAVSDLLLGVFCMPFTLVGALLREFVFGEAMCKTISYLQGTSVAVNAWTLVAISLERYYAVCEPLKSRRWQTTSHAYKITSLIWCASLSLMLPVAFVSQLLPRDPPDKYKCREKWPSDKWEGVFNIMLDSVLLAVPLCVMATAYSRICSILRQGIQSNKEMAVAICGNEAFNYTCTSIEDSMACGPPKVVMKWPKAKGHGRVTDTSLDQDINSAFSQQSSHRKTTSDSRSAMSIRSSNFDQRLAVKRRVIRMLFVVVLEFFICWTPIYVVNTVSSFDSTAVYSTIGYFGVSFLHLLSYVSSCCNPITYCFMNRNFRREFLLTFTKLCHKRVSHSQKKNSYSVNGRMMPPGGRPLYPFTRIGNIQNGIGAGVS